MCFVATWVDRFSVDDASMDQEHEDHLTLSLTPVQRDKFSHFFTYLLDHDRDDIISDQDFEAFIEVSISSSSNSSVVINVDNFFIMLL